MSYQLQHNINAQDEVTSEKKARLLEGMSRTMQQKLAFATPFFRFYKGARILDIGCADGQSSYELAACNPNIEIVGVDYDADYIQMAREAYQLPNLTFQQADVRDLDFPAESFDAILNSSVMHEVFSFSGYSHKALEEALASQMNVLKPDGVMLLRDFVQPSDPEAMTYLDLPAGESTGSAPEDLSLPDLLRLYADIANNEKSAPLTGFFCEDVGETEDGWHRFYLPHKWAREFILRKDYRDRFLAEASEQYTVLRDEDYRRLGEENGARVVYRSPYRNPWIVRNRHEGQFRLFDEEMQPLEGPPTNYVAVLQKSHLGESLSFREHKQAPETPNFLVMEHFHNATTGKHYDLASRPGPVFDVLPYEWRDNELYIYAKTGYPRPIVNTHPRQMSPNLDGRHWSGHMIEPLAAAQSEQQTELSIREMLANRTNGLDHYIKGVHQGMQYFTAPADTNEHVCSNFVELDNAPYREKLTGCFSGFSDDGHVRAFRAKDLLTSVQVGTLPEPRLELNLYALCRQTGVNPGAWISRQPDIAEGEQTPDNMTHLGEIDMTQDGVFEATAVSDDYLSILRSIFMEEAAPEGHRQVTHHKEFEFVVPQRDTERDISTNNAIMIPLVRDTNSGEIMIGLERRDFPSVQQHGQEGLLTLPGLRLPSTVKNLDQAHDYVAGQWPGDSDTAAVTQLGESYFPSMGIMPNRVYSFCVSDPDIINRDDLHFVPLREVFQNQQNLSDMHLMLAINRITHAMGYWDDFNHEPALTTSASVQHLYQQPVNKTHVGDSQSVKSLNQ